MKKLLCLFLAGITALSVTACGGGGAVTLPDYGTSQAVADEQTLESAVSHKTAAAFTTDETKALTTDEAAPTAETASAAAQPTLDEHAAYTTRDDVALYIHLYSRLPENFITKKQAQELGWNGGSLEPYAAGCCIGGDRFGNYEGLLPAEDGRVFTECDIDTLGADSRGAKRIVFSNDGLIYYTDDHYKSFTLLYGEE